MNMFFLTFNLIWNLFFFFYTFYVIFFFSFLFYFLPNLKIYFNYKKFKKNNFTYFINAFDLGWLIFSFLFFLYFTNYCWTSYSISAWFGHFIFTSLQKNFFFINLFFLSLIVLVYVSSFYATSQEVFDYWITIFNFHIWTTFLFFSNSLFTLVFFLEMLSTLIFLLIVTSTFSTTYFYSNINFNENSYFTSSISYTYIQTLIFFFWISLISSLNLFFFLILIYIKFLTFDWYLLETIFFFLNHSEFYKNIFSVSLIWVFFFLFAFLKCGLVPFYFWKPTFFKGLPLYTIFFYIVYFYFFIFVFFVIFFLTYLSEIFFFYVYIFNFFLIVGFTFLFCILCEAQYLKSFLALSSILNTLFVFLALASVSDSSFIFFL